MQWQPPAFGPAVEMIMGFTANTSSMSTDFAHSYPEENVVTPQVRRRRTTWTTILLVAGAVGLYLVATRTHRGPEGWGDDFGAAMAQANVTGKKVVLDFYMDDCPPCIAMDQLVLGKESVRTALSGMVPVRINGYANRELTQRFHVSATPTYIVINSAGEPLARTEGYMSPEDFIQFLHSADQPAPVNDTTPPTQAGS